MKALGETYGFAPCRRCLLSAMFILEDDVGVAKDVFRGEVVDIIARRRGIYGADPFIGLTVSRDEALHRLLQVVVDLGVQIRERYALS